MLFHQDVLAKNDIFLCPNKMLFHPCYATTKYENQTYTSLVICFWNTITVCIINFSFLCLIYSCLKHKNKTRNVRNLPAQNRHKIEDTAPRHRHHHSTARPPRDHYTTSRDHYAKTPEARTPSKQCATTAPPPCNHYSLRLAQTQIKTKEGTRKEKREER